ncbi:hypothetical protein SAMN05216383_103183 [Prevotella sp. KH2C16]|nr:hypothetical protein SAMN05216383_103183 [Prevotella sp. KH2C16]
MKNDNDSKHYILHFFLLRESVNNFVIVSRNKGNKNWNH